MYIKYYLHVICVAISDTLLQFLVNWIVLYDITFRDLQVLYLTDPELVLLLFLILLIFFILTFVLNRFKYISNAAIFILAWWCFCSCHKFVAPCPKSKTGFQFLSIKIQNKLLWKMRWTTIICVLTLTTLLVAV